MKAAKVATAVVEDQAEDVVIADRVVMVHARKDVARAGPLVAVVGLGSAVTEGEMAAVAEIEEIDGADVVQCIVEAPADRWKIVHQ